MEFSTQSGETNSYVDSHEHAVRDNGECDGRFLAIMSYRAEKSEIVPG